MWYLLKPPLSNYSSGPDPSPCLQAGQVRDVPTTVYICCGKHPPGQALQGVQQDRTRFSTELQTLREFCWRECRFLVNLCSFILQQPLHRSSLHLPYKRMSLLSCPTYNKKHNSPNVSKPSIKLLINRCGWNKILMDKYLCYNIQSHCYCLE